MNKKWLRLSAVLTKRCTYVFGLCDCDLCIVGATMKHLFREQERSSLKGSSLIQMKST